MIDIIEDWHTGMQACIKMNDVRTEKFNIEVGLRQGDVMSPTLFNIYFSMVMQVMKKQLKLKFEELQKETIGVPIMFDTSVQSWDEKWKFGRLEWTEEVVTHRVRKINPKLEFEDLWNTLFADDAALVSTEEPSLQILVTIFNEVASAFGLTVSIEKSLILHQKKYTN